MARQLSIEISHAVSRRSEKVFLSTPEGSSNGAFSLNVWIRSPNTIAKDMAYDVGLTELARFRNLIAACGARDFATAANHCHRQRSREPRNTATRLLLFAAANAAA